MRTYLGLLLFFLILVIGSVFIVWNSVEKRQSLIKAEIIPTQSPVKVNDKPRIYLQREGGNLYTQAESLTVSVYGNSKGSRVVGYDVVVKFDPLKVRYDSYKAHNTNFELFVQENEGEVLLTGVKAFSVDPFVLENIVLADITFTPLVSEPLSFQLEFIRGNKQDTNMIDIKSNDILESAGSLLLKPAQRISLALNETINIGEDLKVTLTKVDYSESLCMDCLSQANITVQQENEKQELVFRFGGIAGFNESTAKAFGYTFELDTLSSGQVELLYGR